jgi:hypothetical protein
MKHNHHLRRAFALLTLVALTAASTTSAFNLPLPSAEAMSSITVVDLKRHLSFLASDELGGRYTFSQSNMIAARYLASQLESYGYRGAARDGSFFQKVPLSDRSVDLSKTGLTLSVGGAREDFKYADDFAVETPYEMSVSGGLVFAGYGVSSPANNHDDYAGLNVKDKIVVIASGLPDPLKGKRLGDKEYGEEAAIKHGAAGVIAVAPQQFLIAWPQLKAYLLRDQVGLPPRPNASLTSFPLVYAGPPLIRSLARALGKEESYLSRPDGKPLQPAAIDGRAEIKMGVSLKESTPAQNVVGILEGADPVLKDEYVAFSAHYDHEKTENGVVYNGADDDGSGTSAVLEIAQAFAVGQRPKRSVLVIFHTAEELGLYGSAYNTDYEPVVPLNKIVANLNIDMIGRSRAEDDNSAANRNLTDKNSVYIIGADRLSSELHKINEQTNADTERLRFDYKYNALNDPEKFYERSDHFNYAKHGVPIIFYFTGVHRDYHRPTDDVDKIDFQKMERITRMIFATGWRVMNLDHRLVVDKLPAPRLSAQ